MHKTLTSIALAATAIGFAAPAFAAFPNDCSTTDTFAEATSCAGVFTSNNGNNLGAGNTTIADLNGAFGDLAGVGFMVRRRKTI
jgi:hypothetical protein